MIRKMSKYAFLIYHKEYDTFLRYLQGLGVVHVDQRNKAVEEGELKSYKDERLRIAELTRRLQPWLSEDKGLTAIEAKADRQIIAEAETMLEQYEASRDEQERIEGLIREQELWGEFSPELLDDLKAKGYYIRAYAVPVTLYTEEYIATYQCVDVARIGTTQYFVRLEDTVSTPCPNAEVRDLPTTRLSVYRERLEETKELRIEKETALRNAAPSIVQQLRHWDTLLSGSIQYEVAKQQGSEQADNKLIYLVGWIPSEGAARLESALQSGGYYYCQSDILEEDRVPISLKNNVFSRGFELISKMYSLPNYNEIDQTVLFAPFFMLFFGLCMGDAGYGLLVFLVSTYLRRKLKKGEDDTAYILMQWLGGGAFFIGLLVGSCFGVTLPYAKPTDYFLNQNNLMVLSIILGLLQIFFAKGVAAYKTQVQRGLKFALAPYSWIIFLIALGAMFATPMLGVELPQFASYALYGVVGLSGLIILFYNTPGANPLLNVGSALWAAYNNASGLLGDTLSYIRLFAIGLTGAVLGSVFNQLAIEQTEGLNAFIRFPLMLIVLLAGHSINIGLALIGALVHPIRLTFVEYYKNSEFEGGGIGYNPLSGDTVTEK
ncbi:MAG: V-type ATPase 116kDa subunit family protein [Porphyromonas sp.]|nr:V-type ATPase 116kDa subunit family protein [Porphyromonas sp.]